MTEKFCRDCEHFREELLMNGFGWCSLDRHICRMDDSCNFAITNDDIESVIGAFMWIEALYTGRASKCPREWKLKSVKKDLKKTILYIERLLKEMEDAEGQNKSNLQSEKADI